MNNYLSPIQRQANGENKYWFIFNMKPQNYINLKCFKISYFFIQENTIACSVITILLQGETTSGDLQIHRSGIDKLSALPKAGPILGLLPANERWHYFVTMSLIGWAQA